MDSFALKLLASFVVGGGWVLLITVAADRFGPRLGGWLGGLPSTIVVAMLFIGWTQGAQAAYDAATAIPLTMAVNTFYLIAFAGMSRHGLTAAISAALLVWAALQTVVVLIHPQDFGWALVWWAVILIAGYAVLRRLAPPAGPPARPIRYSPLALAGRAALGGGVIALAVWLSKVGGPIFGSVFATFPAVFTSTLLISARSAGMDASRSLILPLMVSAMVNVVVYVAALRPGLAPLGIVGASLAAYLVSLSGGALTYWFLNGRQGAQPAGVARRLEDGAGDDRSQPRVSSGPG